MVTVVLSSDKIVEVTDGSEIDTATFEMMLKSLNSSKIADVIELAYFLRFCYTQASRLLDMAEKKTQTQQERQEVRIQKAALLVQHGMDAKEILDRLDGTDDRRYEFVRGIFLLNNGHYEDAQFCFEKVGYKRGLEMCAVMRKNMKMIGASTDPVVRCYYSSDNWKEFESAKESKDFLYRIGKSEVFDSAENVDVQLRQIEDEMEVTKDKAVLRSLGERLSSLVDSGHSSPEIFYNIGKTYHLRGENTTAAKWYEKALEIDMSYLPAEFNLARINGKPIKRKQRNSAISDHNAITALKNLEFDVDLDGCSGSIRKMCWTIIQSRLLNTSVLSEIDSLKTCVPSIVVENNKAILLNSEDSVKIYTELLNIADSSYLEFIKYNLGILKRDPDILDGCGISEAQMYKDYFRKNTTTANLKLRAYLTGNRHLLDGMDDPFSAIFSGNASLSDYLSSGCTTGDLDKAEAFFRMSLKSPYCINGLGICAVLRNNIDGAIHLFNQVVSEIPVVGLNLAFCYLIREDYKKAAECLVGGGSAVFSRRKSGSLTDEEIFLLIAEKSKNSRLVDQLIEYGFSGAKKIKALLLLEKGDVCEAEKLGLDDKEIQDKIKEVNEKEVIRKRKVAEIEEYRKRRML